MKMVMVYLDNNDDEGELTKVLTIENFEVIEVFEIILTNKISDRKLEGS